MNGALIAHGNPAETGGVFSCQKCAHSVIPEGETQGECRRFPPTISMFAAANPLDPRQIKVVGQTAFPVVGADSHCGEFSTVPDMREQLYNKLKGLC